jgi:hypothetical protein
MVGKFLVTNYDRDELVSMIKDTFKEELNDIITHKEKGKEYDILLTSQEVVELLKISLVTLSKYQKEGTLPFYKLG